MLGLLLLLHLALIVASLHHITQLVRSIHRLVLGGKEIFVNIVCHNAMDKGTIVRGREAQVETILPEDHDNYPLKHCQHVCLLGLWKCFAEQLEELVGLDVTALGVLRLIPLTDVVGSICPHAISDQPDIIVPA